MNNTFSTPKEWSADATRKETFEHFGYEYEREPKHGVGRWANGKMDRCCHQQGRGASRRMGGGYDPEYILCGRRHGHRRRGRNDSSNSACRAEAGRKHRKPQQVCHAGVAIDTWVAGDSKTMTIDGVNYQFDIVGKNHDTYTAGGVAPLTFGLHDCYGTKYPMNSSNTNSTGWDDSKMRTETLTAILAKMPENIQNGIRAVNKLTATSGMDSTIKTASDKLFTFSEMEVYGSTSYSYSGEGKQYDYYKAGNSKVKKVGSTASRWWLRSPIAGVISNFCAVYTDGSIDSFNASYSYGVCFGFCF